VHHKEEGKLGEGGKKRAVSEKKKISQYSFFKSRVEIEAKRRQDGEQKKSVKRIQVINFYLYIIFFYRFKCIGWVLKYIKLKEKIQIK